VLVCDTVDSSKKIYPSALTVYYYEVGGLFVYVCLSLSKLIESSHTPRRVFSIFFCEKQERPIKIAHQRYLEIMLGLRGV